MAYKGHIPWNKGKKGVYTSEALKKMSEKKLGRTPWNKGLEGYQAGEKHYNWKGGISPQDKLERQKFRKQFYPTVMKRDNYTCQICLQYGGKLQVDHIKKWSEYPELRYDINNCRTLCMACHYYVTFKRKLPQGVVWGHNLNKRVAS